MSVLFQALNRAANEYRKQQQFPVVSLLPSGGREGVVGYRIAAITGVAAVSVIFLIGCYFIFSQQSSDLVVSLAQTPIVSDGRGSIDAAGKISPPDTDQGIMLSADSLAATVSESDTEAVMQKIKDLPVASGMKEKKARIIVHGDTEKDSVRSAEAAYSLQKRGKYKEAIEIWRQILLGNPDDIVARSNLVSALADVGTSSAMGELKDMVEARPQFAPAYAALARLLAARNDMNEAVRYLKKAVDLEPGRNLYRLSLAILYDRMGNEDNALTLYKESLESKPSDAEDNLPVTWDTVERRVSYLASR